MKALAVGMESRSVQGNQEGSHSVDGLERWRERRGALWLGYPHR